MGVDAPVGTASLSHRLLAVARRQSREVWEWVDGEWRSAGGTADGTGDPVAIIGAAEVLDHGPLELLKTLAAGARVFVVGGNPSAAAEVRGLAVAGTWLAEHAVRVISIDDRAGQWISLGGGGAIRGGTVVGFLGTPPLVLAAVAHLGDLGGASRAHLELAAELVRRGHLVHTFIPAWSSRALAAELRAAGVSVSTHSCRWWVAVGKEQAEPADAGIGVPDLVVKLGSIAPDLVLTETAVLPGGALAARELNVAHAWMIHERIDPEYDLHPPGPPRELGTLMRSLSVAVLVNSRFVAEHFFGDVPPAALVAPISVAEFDRISRALGRRDVPVHHQRPFTIGVAGQILPAKGQLDAVDAVSLLVKAGRRVRLRLFGGGSQEAVEQLRRRIQASGVADSVVLEGHRRDAVDELATCDAVAIVSWAEGFSRVAVEAAAAGVPVVYAESGGIVEYMSDGLTGLAVKPRDPEALAAALVRLMDDPQLGPSLAAEAAVRVRSWLVKHSAPDTVQALAANAREQMLRREWGQELVSEMTLRGVQDVVSRVVVPDLWLGAQLNEPAAFQGAKLRGERMSRLLAQWVGHRGTGRSLLPRGAAGAVGRLGGPLPRRVRVALLVAAVDPMMDSLVVERLVDEDWYRREYGVALGRDPVVEFARVGLRAGHRPNEYLDPEWYRTAYPDVARAGILPVQHYLSDGCFEGRNPGPVFDPDAYLRANPDVAGSLLLPLEHYILFGRSEGRTW